MISQILFLRKRDARPQTIRRPHDSIAKITGSGQIMGKARVMIIAGTQPLT